VHLLHTMPTDLLTLLRRDHTDFQDELSQLLDPNTGVAELRLALDGVRLGLTAHAEAEDIVLGKFEMIPALEILIAQARAAHVSQEHALSALVSSRPQTVTWRERAYHLRELVQYHATQEERYLLPALRHHVPSDHFAKLAGAFATERLRQLAMLQPSAPFYIPGHAEAHAS
jgi:hemerythrin HHE cation binding domain-containing protein